MRRIEENKEKGITLIALVVTVVILLILAGVGLSMVLGNQGVLKKAKDAGFKTTVGEYNDKLQLYLADKYTKGILPNEINASTPEEIKAIIENMSDEDVLKFKIESGELIYTGSNEEEKNWAEEVGVKGGDKVYVTLFEAEISFNEGNPYNYIELSYDKFQVGICARLTIESDEFSGDIAGTVKEDENPYNPFFGGIIENGKYKGCSYQEIVNYVTNEPNIKCIAFFGSQDNITGITNLTNCKITKGQELIRSKMIYKGIIEATRSENQVPEGTPELELNKSYLFEVEYNGNTEIYETMLGMLFSPPVFHVVKINDNTALLMYKNVIWLFGGNDSEDKAILKSIYENGNNEDYLEENGFVICRFNGNPEWKLVDTPDNEYVLPTSVAGIDIETIYVDALKGTPIVSNKFDFSVFEAEQTTVNSVIWRVGSGEVEDFQGLTYFANSSIDLTYYGSNINVDNIPKYVRDSAVIYILDDEGNRVIL